MAKPRIRLSNPFKKGDDDMAKRKHRQQQKPKTTYTPPPKPKTEFDSGGMTQEIRPIRRPDDPPEPAFPRVLYTPFAWGQIELVVDVCEKEVGWFGVAEPFGDDYLVKKIYVPEQTVSMAETDIKGEAMGEIVEEVIEDGFDPLHLCYWGHSHVNMGVTPSGQDETQIKEYLDDYGDEGIFIRGIYNKKGDSKVDVYCMASRRVYQRVEDLVYVDPLPAEEESRLLEVIKDNVNERTYGGYWGGLQNNRPAGSAANNGSAQSMWVQGYLVQLNGLRTADRVEQLMTSTEYFRYFDQLTDIEKAKAMDLEGFDEKDFDRGLILEGSVDDMTQEEYIAWYTSMTGGICDE